MAEDGTYQFLKIFTGTNACERVIRPNRSSAFSETCDGGADWQ